MTNTNGTWADSRDSMGDTRKVLREHGYKVGDLVGIPWMLAFALRDRLGFWLRSDCIWDKPNGMPESVTCRPGKAHEYVFQFSKSKRVFYDVVAVRRKAKQPLGSPTRTGQRKSRDLGHCDSPTGTLGANYGPEHANLRSVWRIPVARSKAAHFAVMPAKLAERCVLAGTSAKGVCSRCGEPWRRVVEKKRVPTRPGDGSKVYPPVGGYEVPPGQTANTRARKSGAEVGNRDPQRHVTRVETLGWEPGCGCDAGEPVPAVVLEPFAGSGTTLAVAVEHGRRAVGCDLFEKFAEMTRRRVERVSPRLAFDAAPTPDPAAGAAQPDLFAGVDAGEG